MTVFCVNGEKYNRIKALLCSEKRLAYNGGQLYAVQVLGKPNFISAPLQALAV